MSKQLLGQKAPDFSLSSSAGEVVKLSDYDGIWKVGFSGTVKMKLPKVENVKSSFDEKIISYHY